MRALTGKKRLIDQWARSELQKLTTDEVVERLSRMRTFFIIASEEAYARGDLKEGDAFRGRLLGLAKLVAEIEAGRKTTGPEIGHSIIAYPIMLAPVDTEDNGDDGSNCPVIH